MNPNVTMISHVHDRRGRTVPVDVPLKGIQTGTVKTQVLQIRGIFARAKGNGPAAKKAVARLKEQLPGVLFSGEFTHRSNQGLRRHSGLICMDLDHLGENLDAVRKTLTSDPYVYALFVSPTGSGLKVVYRIPPVPALHGSAFQKIQKRFEKTCRVRADESAKDLSRICFMSYDPDLYWNPKAPELHLRRTRHVASEIPTSTAQRSRESASNDSSTDQIRDALKQVDSRNYRTWVKIGLSLKHHFADVNDELGWVIYDEWSQRVPDVYNRGRNRAIWDSFKASGSRRSLTIASLFFEARKRGHKTEPKDMR